MARPLWIISLLTLWTASPGLAQTSYHPTARNYVVFESRGSTTTAPKNGPETLPPPSAYPSAPATWSAVSSNGGMTAAPALGATPYVAAGPADAGYGGCATCGAGAHRPCDLHSLC